MRCDVEEKIHSMLEKMARSAYTSTLFPPEVGRTKRELPPPVLVARTREAVTVLASCSLVDN